MWLPKQKCKQLVPSVIAFQRPKLPDYLTLVVPANCPGALATCSNGNFEWAIAVFCTKLWLVQGSNPIHEHNQLSGKAIFCHKILVAVRIKATRDGLSCVYDSVVVTISMMNARLHVVHWTSLLKKTACYTCDQPTQSPMRTACWGEEAFEVTCGCTYLFFADEYLREASMQWPKVRRCLLKYMPTTCVTRRAHVVLSTHFLSFRRNLFIVFYFS